MHIVDGGTESVAVEPENEYIEFTTDQSKPVRSRPREFHGGSERGGTGPTRQYRTAKKYVVDVPPALGRSNTTG